MSVTDRSDAGPRRVNDPLPEVDYRALFESGTVPRLVITPDFRIVCATDSYLQSTMTRREVIVGRSVFDVFPDDAEQLAAAGDSTTPSLHTALRASLEQVLATRQPHAMDTLRYDIPRPASAGGGMEERYWKPTNAPVLDARGDVSLIINRVEDVTNDMRLLQHQAEQRRRDAEHAHALEVMNQELEAFSYSVSHDLRAPLRHITGFASMLNQSPSAAVLQETDRRHLRIILDGATRMGRLIDDLLAFSRTSRVALAREEVDLAQLIADVRQEVDVRSDGHDVVWQIAGLPVVRGDRALLRLVFVNLLSNALKYSSTRARAEIEVGTVAGGPGETVLFVRDNGVGFDMQYVGKLFGVFQRLHSDKAFEGTGIGLANVRRIIQRHGGRVWADAAIDGGATFFVALPGGGHAIG